MSPIHEDDEFVARYLLLGRQIAARKGFATGRRPGDLLMPDARLQLVQAKMLQAAGALTELGQWLEDDDVEVRRHARDAIHRCLQIAYIGDQPEPTRGHLERGLNQVDGWLSSLLGRFVHPDSAIPSWTRPHRLRHLRGAGIGIALVAAVLTAGFLWDGRPLLGVLFLGVFALFDTLEGSFARVTRMRDPQLRWLSCVFSHIDDLIVVFGMVLFVHARGDVKAGELILVATAVSLMGSLVRVSALQAGYRFWRSPLERVVRFGAFFGFAAACTFGDLEVATVVASSLLMGFGIGEAIRVMRRAAKLRFARGGFIFLSDSGTDCWSFDYDDVTPESALFDRTAPTVDAVIGKERG